MQAAMTDQTRGRAASAPVRNISGRTAVRLATIGALLTVIILWILVTETFTVIAAGDITTLPIDFNALWSAASLAAEGRPLDALNLEILQERQDLKEPKELPFLYPPGMLMLLTPLGLMPFQYAWLAMMLVGSLAIAGAFWAMTGGRALVVAAFVLSPGYLSALFIGQTSLLWTAALIGALVAIRSQHHVLAGILIGLLTLKPQLGLLIPVALIAAGHWRVFWAATVTTVLVALLPTLYYGFEYWPLLVAANEQHSGNFIGNAAVLHLMVTLLGGLAGLGLPIWVALCVQFCAIVLAVVLVWRAWRDPDLSWALKAAILLTATAFSSPYFWYYETALLVPAALLMVYGGALGGRIGVLVLVLMWAGSGPYTLVNLIGNVLTDGGTRIEFRFFLLPVTIIAFALTVLAIRRAQARPTLDP